jgi:hypothetical protein
MLDSVSFSDDLNAIASWFFGPCAENEVFVEEFDKHIVRRQAQGRKEYKKSHDDPNFITDDMQNSEVFKDNIKELEKVL